MIDNREVGRRIAQLRQERGLTQMQLAAMMNVSHQAVSKWESGAAIPDIQTLLELTRFFGLTVEQLTGADLQEEPLEPEEGVEADEAQEGRAPEGGAGGEQANQGNGDERSEVRSNMNIKQLLQMAPFMTREVVAEIALAMDGPLSAEDIARLAPFMTQEGVEALVLKHHPEFSWDTLRRLAPHMRRETVDELARSIASGQRTVRPGDDSFNRTMDDLGRAFDGLGRGMDKAVRKAIRIGGSVLNEVSSALSGLANDVEDATVAADPEAQARSERMRSLRRRAFERALDEGRWDWLGEHIEELDEGDELRQSIARRAREQGLRDWLDEHMDGCVDEEAVLAAIQSGDWDWLRDSLDSMEPEQRLRAARAALEARRWGWLEECMDEIDFGESAVEFARELWRGGNRELAARFAEECFHAPEQYDALFREALAAGDGELAAPLWDEVSPDCAREALLGFAARADWAQVEAHIDCADAATLEALMEQAVEQGNFDAVDMLDEQM